MLSHRHWLKVKGNSIAHSRKTVAFRPLPSCRFMANLFFVTTFRVPLLTWVECLVAWPIRLHTQVMSPTSVLTWTRRTPWQPPEFPAPRQRHHNLHHRGPREGFNIQEHPAAASIPQQAEFPQCHDLLVIASGNSGGMVRIWREIEIKTSCVHKNHERKVDLAVRGERMAQQKLYEAEAEAEVEARNWKKEIMTSLFKRSIRSLNLNDFSNIKQVDGQIRLREIKSACMKNCNWEIRSFMQEIKNWRIEKNLLRRNRSSKTSQN